ncbi:MAG: tripartite tricarboxylate transporter TctB family protein [Betaproteobacteria bacterium]|nr:tripartite tricarboxylate transporter TctB family protein [Betaproteobacteria bacterium]
MSAATPSGPAAGRGRAGVRLAALALLACALVGLWQAWRLERWSFEGPGPGLFPALVAGLCVLLAAVVLCFPGRAGGEDADGASSSGGGGSAGDGRRMALYAVSLGVLALGAAYAGIALTALAVSVLIIRFAEGRSWRAALVYGLVCALVALAGFGWLLRVDLPAGPVERAFFSLVR